jgi:hypothetical protein
LEFRAFGGGDGTSANVAGLVPTVTETLPFDPPAGAHPVGVAPFGAITCAFPGKILQPILSFLQKEFLDEGNVLDHAIVVAVAGSCLPLLFLVSSPRKTTVVFVCFVVGTTMKLGERMIFNVLLSTNSMMGLKFTS